MRRRFRSGSLYIALIGIGQVAAVVAGILAVRSMPKADYAAYSAASAAIAAAVAVADSGTGSVLMARLAASVGQTTVQQTLMGAALSVRRRTSVVVLVIVGTGLVYVFVGLHLPVFAILVSLLIVIVTVSNSLLRSLYVTEVQLQRRYLDLVGADASGAGLRLILTVGVSFLALSSGASTVVFLAIALLGSLVQTALVRRVSGFRGVTADAASSETGAFREAVRATLPWTALMIAGEQLINVLLAAYGNATAIAEIGALTRYAMAFALVTSVLGTLVGTAIAHTSRERGALLSTLSKTIAGGLVVCGGYVAGLWLFRGPLLGLLGAQYSHLESMFFVLSIGSATAFFSSVVLGMFVHARGWVHGNWVFGPALALWVVWAAVIVQPRDGMSAAWVMLGLQVPTLVSQVARIVIGLRRDARAGDGAGPVLHDEQLVSTLQSGLAGEASTDHTDRVGSGTRAVDDVNESIRVDGDEQ